jgi:hypothetical protein
MRLALGLNHLAGGLLLFGYLGFQRLTLRSKRGDCFGPWCPGVLRVPDSYLARRLRNGGGVFQDLRLRFRPFLRDRRSRLANA